MKEVQLVNQEESKIVSQIDSIEKIKKDSTMTLFETIKVKGLLEPQVIISILILQSMIFQRANVVKT